MKRQTFLGAAVTALLGIGLAACGPAVTGAVPSVWSYAGTELDLYRRAAERGDAGGEVNLGYLHHNGWRGASESPAEAARLWRLAAQQGNATALTNLAVLHMIGRGVEKSAPEAARLLSLAARQGDARAEEYLAAFWRASLGGLAPDDPTALAALRATAARELEARRVCGGRWWAVLELARLQETGTHGVAKNLDAAIGLLEQLVERRDGCSELDAARAALAALRNKRRAS